tara:strand:- start:142 stop:363 length:222 start_codon:yes stop_codon:yes gene_type:complete
MSSIFLTISMDGKNSLPKWQSIHAFWQRLTVIFITTNTRMAFGQFKQPHFAHNLHPTEAQPYLPSKIKVNHCF